MCHDRAPLAVHVGRRVTGRLAACPTLQAYSPEALVLHGRNFAAAKLATSFALPAPAGMPVATAAGAALAGHAPAAVQGGEGKASAGPARADTAGEQPMAM